MSDNTEDRFIHDEDNMLLTSSGANECFAHCVSPFINESFALTAYVQKLLCRPNQSLPPSYIMPDGTLCFGPSRHRWSSHS